MSDTEKMHDFDDPDESVCWVCGGEGYIMAADGDGSDWGEDTYSGPMDAVIKCRHCNGGQR
jgi:hypothetical protein